MQFSTLVTLSAIVAAAAGVQAAPSAHAANHHNVARSPGSSHHKLSAREATNPLAQAAHNVAKKRSQKRTQKKCRLRPTSSSLSSAPPASTNGSSSGSSVSGSASSTGSVTSTNSGAAPPSSTAPSTQNFDTPWSLDLKHQGKNFFDGWTFWNAPDPTHGTVNFVDAGTAWNTGLISVTDTQATMRVSTEQYQDMRQSVRIHGQHTFNINSLVVMDAEHMPTGCGTWPAWWANGPNWPAGGEIDILEGVHDSDTNAATLHTSQGCTAVSDASNPSSGQLMNANCGSSGSSNTGCGFADVTSQNTYGAGFNSAKGGVYAMQWVDAGISVWFFPRSAIPADLVADKPMPWTWQQPFARWSASGCSPRDFFHDQIAIFDTTFCGDWAGATWGSSGCAQKTGFESCERYVRENGSAFSEAYWTVNYVKYFKQ
jgi:hypothetical protein